MSDVCGRGAASCHRQSSIAWSNRPLAELSDNVYPFVGLGRKQLNQAQTDAIAPSRVRTRDANDSCCPEGWYQAQTARSPNGRTHRKASTGSQRSEVDDAPGLPPQLLC